MPPVPSPHHRLTLADYLEAEQLSPQRHEFAGGQIYLMTRGSPRHNYLTAQILRLLAAHLQGGPCFCLSSDQRIATNHLYTYADGSVFCGEMEMTENQTARNPVIVIEVLSDSTREYDLGEKLQHYQTIGSLRHVLLMEQDAPDMTVVSRTSEEWVRRLMVGPTEVLTLEDLGIRLPLSEIYEGLQRLPT